VTACCVPWSTHINSTSAVSIKTYLEILQTYVSMGTGYLDESTPIWTPSIFSAMATILSRAAVEAFVGDEIRVGSSELKVPAPHASDW
jgi:hypothetical protein